MWNNTTSAYNFTTNSGSLSSVNPCLKDSDGDGVIDLLDIEPFNPDITTSGISLGDAGLCSHRFDPITSTWDFSEGYEILTNGPSAFEKDSSYNPVENRYAIGRST